MSRALTVDDLVVSFCWRWEKTRDLTACMRFIRDTVRIGLTKAHVRAGIEDRRQSKGLPPAHEIVPKRLRAVNGAISDLVCAVASARGVSIALVVGPNRSQRIAAVRFEAMWLARAYGFSYPDVGAAMLRRHTTVMAGERVVEARIAKRAGLRKELLAIGARAGGARQIEKRAA